MKQFFGQCLPSFSNNVNGYIIITIEPEHDETIILFDLIYTGNVSQAKNELRCIADYNSGIQLKQEYDEYGKFWDWEVGHKDIGEEFRQYGFDKLLSNENLTNSVYLDLVHNYTMSSIQFLQQSNGIDGFVSLFYTILGGAVSDNGNDNIDSATPYFRKARVDQAGLVYYRNNEYDDQVRLYMDNYDKIFDIYSLDGSYFNVDNPDNTEWKTQFWGQQNYERLLQIKNTYDPMPYLFNCHHCIGDQP